MPEWVRPEVWPRGVHEDGRDAHIDCKQGQRSSARAFQTLQRNQQPGERSQDADGDGQSQQAPGRSMGRRPLRQTGNLPPETSTSAAAESTGRQCAAKGTARNISGCRSRDAPCGCPRRSNSAGLACPDAAERTSAIDPGVEERRRGEGRNTASSQPAVSSSQSAGGDEGRESIRSKRFQTRYRAPAGRRSGRGYPWG